MSEVNKSMTINVPNSLYENVKAVSPFSYQIHEMMGRSISTPDPNTLIGWDVQLGIDEDRLAEQEDKGSSHTASPFWEITEYTTEEINVIREADRLDPDLAEHYKDLLED